MEKLTYKDCDNLIQAVEKWEQEDFGAGLMNALFSSMLTKDDPEAQAEMKKSEEKRKEEEAFKTRERKKQGAMLKAKLYQIQSETSVLDGYEIQQ